MDSFIIVLLRLPKHVNIDWNDFKLTKGCTLIFIKNIIIIGNNYRLHVSLALIVPLENFEYLPVY